MKWTVDELRDSFSDSSIAEASQMSVNGDNEMVRRRESQRSND
jgi:hypothetical protein